MPFVAFCEKQPGQFPCTQSTKAPKLFPARDTAVKPLLIELKNVSLLRGRSVLMRNLNWKIRAGESWALLGAAGCGKTSIAEVLAGTRKTFRGRIVYSFTDEDTPGDREVILLSTESQMDARAGINPYYQARWNSFEEEQSETVRHFLSARSVYGLTRYHVLTGDDVPSHFRASRKRALEVTGIASLLRSKLMDLSNGELRKVLIARALSQKPRLLIFDDPLSGLDAHSQRAFPKIVRAAHELGISLLFTASGLDDLPPDCASKFLRIRNQRVVFAGRPGPRISTRARTQLFSPKLKHSSARRKHGDVVIDIRGATVKYGKKLVLDCVSWKVRYGERWAVLGPNGAGKTTLLGLVLGDNPQAYACDIRLFGRKRGSGETIWEIKRNIGHVAPDLQSFLPLDQTGEMIVCSGFHDTIGMLGKCSAAARRTSAHLLRKLGIGRLAARMFGEMSSSERRLVLIARALVKKPRILILDEPCQGLDATTRKRVITFLDRLACAHDVTLIAVAHRPEDLPKSITNILRLDAGRVSADRSW